MAFRPYENRGRAYGVAGTIAVHVLVVGALVWLGAGRPMLPRVAEPRLVTVDVTQPPPPPAPPPPDEEEEGAAAPPSRGNDDAPAPPPPARPLAPPTPAPVAPDPGSQQGAGLGSAAGSGAGLGGEGDGRGAGDGGAGRGSGIVNPPVRIAGGLTNADYRNARAPQGALGTVRVSFRVRRDGAVDQCAVIGPSGFPMFDEATCRLIQQRFRYRPATDGTGQAIDWTIRTEYTWAPR